MFLKEYKGHHIDGHLDIAPPLIPLIALFQSMQYWV